MLDSQYLRIERIAGGTGSTVKDFVRACHTKLSKNGKHYSMRESRHAWIKDGLNKRNRILDYKRGL